MFVRILGGADEMAQQLKPLADLAKDPGLVPSTHIGWLTISCNSSSMGANAFFWLWRALQTCSTHIDKQVRADPDGVCPKWRSPCLSVLQRAAEAQREAPWPESHRQWVAELGWEPSPLLAWKDGRKPNASATASTGKFTGCSKVSVGLQELWKSATSRPRPLQERRAERSTREKRGS